MRVEDGFDEKGVAFRRDAAIKQAAQGALRVATKAARRVMRAKPRDAADVAVRDLAQKPAAPRPVRDAPALAVARAYDNIRPGARLDERRDSRRVVREVGVQLHEPRVAALDCVTVAIDEAPTVAARPRPPENREARVRA